MKLTIIRLLLLCLILLSLAHSRKRKAHSKRHHASRTHSHEGGVQKCKSPRVNEQPKGSIVGKCPKQCPETRCDQRGNQCCLYSNKFNDNVTDRPHVHPKKSGRNNCLPPKLGEQFKGSDTRICENKCPFTRCQQTGIKCCYYNDPRLEKGRFGNSRGNAAVTRTEGNFNQYSGSSNLGTGYPVSDGSGSYSSRFGTPYQD